MNTYDYSQRSTSMTQELLKFLHGLRGERSNPVRLTQIQAYFCGTPRVFIQTSLDYMLDHGYIVIRRTSMHRKRTGYVYELTARGRSLFERERYYRASRGC